MKFIRYEGADKWKKRFSLIFETFYRENEKRQAKQDEDISLALRTATEGSFLVLADGNGNCIMADDSNVLSTRKKSAGADEFLALEKRVAELEEIVKEMKGGE